MVYYSINPVHSILFLILTFVNSAFILVLFKIEFLSLLFIIIYVGAIAVLFLFVIMMLNIKKNVMTSVVNKNYLFLAIVVFAVSCYKMENIFDSFLIAEDLFLPGFVAIDFFADIYIIGQSLYNYYFLLVLLGGLILLIAMVGAVILTLEFKDIHLVEVDSRQLSRTTETLGLFSTIIK